MKTLKTMLCAVALTAAFVTARADLVITASGTAEIQTTPPDGGTKAAFTTLSFNNKYIYTVLSNAVAGVSYWAHTNIASTNLPPDGYIAFRPEASLGSVPGIFYVSSVPGVFYVTNKAGFYFPLSGFDAHNNYYSWMELDSQNDFGYDGGKFQFGWDEALYGVASYNLNSKTTGTQNETSAAVLYIHDDPYCYDDADNPNIFWDNNIGQGDDFGGSNVNAIEVRGLLTATFPTVGGVATISSLSISGSGNFAYAPGASIASPTIGVVKTGTVKFAK